MKFSPKSAPFALVALVDWLHATGAVLLDVQWCTPHLASLGVVEVPRREYLALLDENEQLRAEMRVKPLHLNNAARVNGGVLMAFGDVVGAAATVANLNPGERTSTLESKTNFFAAGLGPVMKATAVLLHAGRTTMVWQTTIRNSGDNSRVAIVTQTQIRLPAKAPAPAGKK